MEPSPSAANGNSKKKTRTKNIIGSSEPMVPLCGVLRLPEGTDGSKVKAEFKDGILKVHLPKTEETKSKSLEVKVQ
jgi:HSP20 family molecular chaperone IbpA